MGFMDKLKGVAEAAKEQAGKVKEQVGAAMEEEKKSQELNKYTLRGFIKGGNIPDMKDKSGFVEFAIDNKASRLLVIYQEYRTGRAVRRLLAEYSLDDVVQFKHDKTEIKEYSSWISISHYNQLILSSGETLEIYQGLMLQTEKTQLDIQKESEEWGNINTVITTFIDKISDEKTKQWVNQFHLDNGGKPPFDENGDWDPHSFFAENMQMSNRKFAEWNKMIRRLS